MAKDKTEIGPKSDAIPTIHKGKNNRIPITAIRTPHVKKRCCHNAPMFLRTKALTTALSNEREISRTASNKQIKTTEHVP